jgi:hypothetical protein
VRVRSSDAGPTISPVLPETDVARIRKLCTQRVPDHARDQVRIELEEERQTVTILECRPPWREDYGPEWTRMPIARLRYVGSTRLWTLYYHRHTGRWERYPLLAPTRRIDELLNEVDRDPICIFWGGPARPSPAPGPRLGRRRSVGTLARLSWSSSALTRRRHVRFCSDAAAPSRLPQGDQRALCAETRSVLFTRSQPQ